MRFVRGKPPLEYLYTRVLLAGGHPQYLGWSYRQSGGQARLKTDAGRSPTWPRLPCREKRLPSSRARTRRSLNRTKAREAVRQIDSGDWWGGLFPYPALSGRNSRHLSFHPMHRSGADAECLGRPGYLRRSPIAPGYPRRHRCSPGDTRGASPVLRARARPDLTRSTIIARSNSAKTPKI
jgi:hypothetical protein